VVLPACSRKARILDLHYSSGILGGCWFGPEFLGPAGLATRNNHVWTLSTWKGRTVAEGMSDEFNADPWHRRSMPAWCADRGWVDPTGAEPAIIYNTSALFSSFLVVRYVPQSPRFLSNAGSRKWGRSRRLFLSISNVRNNRTLAFNLVVSDRLRSEGNREVCRCLRWVGSHWHVVHDRVLSFCMRRSKHARNVSAICHYRARYYDSEVRQVHLETQKSFKVLRFVQAVLIAMEFTQTRHLGNLRIPET